MITDVAQLGDQDVHVLNVLASVYGDVANSDASTNNSGVFLHKLDEQFAAMLNSKINANDFLSSCSRLCGFGLAVEETRTSGDLRLAHRCFYPTRRGMVLWKSLKEYGATVAGENRGAS